MASRIGPAQAGFWIMQDPRADIVTAPAQVLPPPVRSGAPTRVQHFRERGELIAAKIGGKGPPV